MQYFITRNGQQLGPFTEAEVRTQLATATLSPQDLVWWEGQANWIPLGQSKLATPSPVTAPTLGGVPPVTPLSPNLGSIKPTSQLAIWSLVLGCLSLFCSLLTAIPAVILGHMGLAEIKRNPGVQGRGMALAGLIIGYIILGITLAYFILIFVVFAAAGSQAKDLFKTITSQIEAAQAAQATNNTDDSSTNSDQSTNAPDSSTNAPTTNSSDSSSTNTPAATPTNQ